MTRIAPGLALSLLLVGCAAADSMREVDPGPHGGEPPTSALYRSIGSRDAALSAAFNSHDIEALMALFDDDVEFYHDAGGLQRHTGVKAGFTGLFGQNNGIRRELVPGTLRVYPIRDYGAMEMGSHRFCHLEDGKQDCGTFEFMQIWQQSGDSWKITRVVSYGH